MNAPALPRPRVGVSAPGEYILTLSPPGVIRGDDEIAVITMRGHVPPCRLRMANQFVASGDLLAFAEAFVESFSAGGEYIAHAAPFTLPELVAAARAAVFKARGGVPA